jgi:exopolyphosphatase/guanosine-5'-triphosphate,3'-diphosphate pyrophosphatase
VAINASVPRRIPFQDAARIAAIDTGSNAIRLVIAEVKSGKQFRILKTVRWPVRLGHRVFLRRQLDRGKVAAAARAFREAEELFEEYGVGRYRAVATSAAREARNGGALARRIFHETSIRLEIISAEEEARLVRVAVAGELGKSERPRLVLDLGGGSLELCLMQRGEPRNTVALPLGTVRMQETFRLNGAISEESAEELSHYVHMMLESSWPDRPLVLEGSVVACGGNAEALARLFPGPRWNGINTLNLRLLKDRMWTIVHLNVDARMEEFDVRRDRAEVMGVAAIILATVGSWLRLRSFLVPGVGVREGILRDLMAASPGQRAAQAASTQREASAGMIFAASGGRPHANRQFSLRA